MHWIMHPACHKRLSAPISKPDLNVHTQLSPALIHRLASTHTHTHTHTHHLHLTWTWFYDTLTGDEYRSETNTDVRQVKQRRLKTPEGCFSQDVHFWAAITDVYSQKKAMCWNKIAFMIIVFTDAFLPKITKLTRLETIKLNAHAACNLTPPRLVKNKCWHLNNAFLTEEEKKILMCRMIKWFAYFLITCMIALLYIKN